VPAEILVPANPPTVAQCPGAAMPQIGDVAPWGSASHIVQAWAVAQLHYPLGTVILDVVEGAPVICRIECHDTYGAHPNLPPAWHKGASLYRPAKKDQGGRLVAIHEPPAGWPSSAA